jgi:hypothetical protein
MLLEKLPCVRIVGREYDKGRDQQQAERLHRVRLQHPVGTRKEYILKLLRTRGLLQRVGLLPPGEHGFTVEFDSVQINT